MLLVVLLVESHKEAAASSKRKEKHGGEKIWALARSIKFLCKSWISGLRFDKF